MNLFSRINGGKSKPIYYDSKTVYQAPGSGVENIKDSYDRYSFVRVFLVILF